MLLCHPPLPCRPGPILVPVLVLTEILQRWIQLINLPENYPLVAISSPLAHQDKLAHKRANKPQKQHKTHSYRYVLPPLSCSISSPTLGTIWKQTDVLSQSVAESGMQNCKSRSRHRTHSQHPLTTLREKEKYITLWMHTASEYHQL